MNLHIFNAHTFACGRTCTPGKECGFGPIFHALGTTTVVSHTTRVAVELRNREALAAAVTDMNGTVMGEGSHRLFETMEQGFGFSLPNWRYPLCLRPDNTLAFDDYRGRWGTVSDIKALEGRYAIAAAKLKAEELGWMSEKLTTGDLLIYHPDGGTMTVKQNGTVESNGFVGTGCDVAAAIENAIGHEIDRTNTDEYFETANIEQL